MRRLLASSLIVLACTSMAYGELPNGDSQPVVRNSSDQNPAAVAGAGAWWDGRTAGLVGGILGSVVGCLGGLIGTLSGMGKWRGLTLGLAKSICLFGVLLLIAGIVALVQSQPYGVWYPLMLAGFLSTVVMGGLLPVLRGRYQQIELRKITAADA